VKVPGLRLVATPPPLGLLAAALPNVKAEEPMGAAGSTSKITKATTPSAITFWFRPAISIGQVPEQFPGDHETSLFAAVAAGPSVMLLTESREASKPRSKFTPDTCAPSNEVRVIATLIPVSPGLPEPLPAEMAAVGVCAVAPATQSSARTAQIRPVAKLDLTELIRSTHRIG